MNELTLEALAKRIEVIEEKLADLDRPQFQSGRGNWDIAAQAAAELRANGGIDFGAIREQDECDLRHANDHMP